MMCARFVSLPIKNFAAETEGLKDLTQWHCLKTIFGLRKRHWDLTLNTGSLRDRFHKSVSLPLPYFEQAGIEKFGVDGFAVHPDVDEIAAVLVVGLGSFNEH